MTEIKKTREANYDLLRAICAIAVIVIHISSTYTNAAIERKWHISNKLCRLIKL